MRAPLPIVAPDPDPRLRRRASSVCLDDHCVTCSDEGVPMRVVALDEPGLALCEDGDGATQLVMTGIVERAVPGDVVLVHAGTALVRLDPHSPDLEHP